MSVLFLEEAKLRWIANQNQPPDVTAVSAAILLVLACNHHGMDRVGLLYLDSSAEMGLRLGLFDREGGEPPLDRFEDEEMRAAAAFAAWGAFGWHTYVLENLFERAVMMASGEKIILFHLLT